MKIAEVESGFQDHLDRPFTDQGFKLRKTDFEFVRRVGDLRFIFRVEIHARTDWFLITPSAFVGSTTINKMFNDILDRTIKVTGTTCGFGIGNECNHERGRYNLETAADVAPTAKSIWLDFEDVASPFFSKVDSLEGINEYINTACDGRCSAGSVSNACKGLIAAHLVGDSRFNELGALYYDFWSKAQSPAIAQDIVTVQKALEDTNAINGA